MPANSTDRSTLEAIGADALDRFIETFNARDPDAWAASLSYPHVRVSARQGAAPVPTERAYADAVTYDAADAMGWHHSEWDTKQILAVSPSKIHASAQWCRYDVAGERILPNNVSYVITHTGDRWGIQARFGVDSPPADDPEATARHAQDLLARWWDAVTGDDADELDGLLRLPFHLVGVGALREATSSAEVVELVDDAVSGAAVQRFTPLQMGTNGVNLGVDFTDRDGHARHALFLVTHQEGRHAVAAASLLPD